MHFLCCFRSAASSVSGIWGTRYSSNLIPWIGVSRCIPRKKSSSPQICRLKTSTGSSSSSAASWIASSLWRTKRSSKKPEYTTRTKELSSFILIPNRKLIRDTVEMVPRFSINDKKTLTEVWNNSFVNYKLAFKPIKDPSFESFE